MADSPPASQVEWSRLLATATVEQVRREVLEHLQWQGAGDLLALDRETACRLRDYFERRAEAALADLDPDEETRERVAGGGWLLAEEALEGTNQHAAAAACYALVHDGSEPADDGDGQALFDRLLMRFKVAFALGLLDESDPDWNRRLADFTAETGVRLVAARQRLPKAAYNFLYFRLHLWLGMQWQSLREYRQADDALGEAALYADEPDDRVSVSLRLAEVAERLGELQGAYERLKLCEGDVPGAEEDTRVLWRLHLAKLVTDLGGPVDSKDLPRFPAPFETLADVSRRLLDGDAPLEPKALQEIAESLREAAEQSGEDDPDLRHASLLHQAILLAAGGEVGALEQAEALLERARALEACLSDERFPLRRELVLARILTNLGDGGEGVGRFAEIIPRIRQVLPRSESVHALGEYLIALGRAGADLGAIVSQVRALYVDLEVLMAEQPLGPARRRVREVHQRAVEAGLMALMASIESRSQDDAEVQEALGWAWRLLMNCRNTEIHWKLLDPGPGLYHLPELEGEFHARLRESLCTGEIGDGSWTPALSALQDYERSATRDRRMSQLHDMRPDGADVSVAYFKLRDVVAGRQPTLVLSYLDDRFDGTVLRDEPGGTEQELERWSRPFFELARDGELRIVVHESAGPARAERDPIEPPPATAVVPGSVAGELVRSPGRRSDRPWYLFPDGLLSTLPVEMLPEHPGADLLFGQRRPVTLCLRPAVPDGVRRPVDFGRGWIGLGGAPAAGEIGRLPGSSTEVRSICRLLEDHGHGPCRPLLGEEARADLLTEAIVEIRPAVLHFAVHGFADQRYPDACALILADRPDRPERELLPYRRIRDLPLDGVELVVLSACSSLIGRSGRAASMEGLAWAFLNRGVTQVIASRYPVDDEATVKFMIGLYRQLLTLPVADALGRARDICLGQEALEPREVAAWSVWC